MERPKYGWAVLSVAGARVGTVAGLNHCCVDVLGEGARRAIRWDGIFVVSQNRVDLSCDASDLARYTCGQHTRRRRLVVERSAYEWRR